MRRLSALDFLLYAVVLSAFCSCLAAPANPSCPTVTLNLEFPIAGFGSYELQSASTPTNNLLERFSKAAFIGAVGVNNYYNSIWQPLVYGNDPIFNQTLIWQGSCYNINIMPIYTAIPVDIHDDVNIALQTVNAERLCKADATAPSQVIAAIDGTFTNSLLYTSLALTCGAYNISTITTLYNDLAFANKNYYPYSARASLRLDAPNLLLVNLLQNYGWTRASVMTVTLPENVNLVNILQQEAVIAGVTLQYNFQSPDNPDCTFNIDQAVNAGFRVLFFLGDYPNLTPCLWEVLVNRKLQQQNYIIVLSFSTYSSGGYSMSQFAAGLNTTIANMNGVFTLTPVLTSSAFGANYVKNFLGKELFKEGIYKIPFSILQPSFLAMCDGVTLVNQGVFGMLGNRLKTVLPQVQASPQAIAVPNPSNTPMQNVQAIANALLSALSLSGTVDSLTYSLSLSADNNTAVSTTVPFSAMRYPTADVYHFFSNASGMSMSATAMGRLIHDSTGDALVKIGIFNYDGSANGTQVQQAYLDMVYNKYVIVNTSVIWPNASLLTSGINNNIPTDRAPTTATTIACMQCLNPLKEINPDNTVYGDLFMVNSAYQLDISQDNPQTYTIGVSCDGTFPVVQSLLPYVTGIIGPDYPLSMGSGQISFYSSNLVSSLKALYETTPGVFNTDGMLNKFQNFSALYTAKASSVVTVMNAAEGAFDVEVLINCNNVANNVSAVLKIAIQPLPDVYTPSKPAQDAMIALNSFGLGLVSLVIFAVIKHRDERAIFSSSFLFLLVILIGFLLLFISSLLTILTASDAICKAKMITFHLGFTIALGSIFVKNYRLHRIFNSKNLLNMTISNRTLLSAVFGLLLIDTIVIVCWIQISGFGIESDTRLHCYTSGAASNAFPGIFALLKGVILLLGIYLTFKVRAVPANFNESRFIAVVIYNTAVLSIVYIVVFFAFNIQPNSLSIFTSVICFLGAFLNLVLFYAPKLLALKNLYLKNDSSSGSTRSSRGKMRSKEKERDRERDREKEARQLGTNNTSTLSQLDPEPIIEEKSGDQQQPSTARGSGSHMPPPDTEHNQGKEKHRTVESVTKRLKGLKGKYLSAVISAKRSNAEHNRLLLRADEVRRLADDFYDELRVLVMDIRLNCERLKKMISTAGSSSEEVQEHLVSVKDMLRLIELPIDNIQCDESTQTYTVMDSARGGSRRTQLHMTSVGSNVTQVSNNTGNTGNTTTSIQMGNFNTLKREQGSLAKSPTQRTVTMPSPSMHTNTISAPTASSAAGGGSPSPLPSGSMLSNAASSNVIMIERDGVPIPLLPLNQTSSMNQPLSGNDMSVTRSFTPRSGRDTDKGSGVGESLGLGGNGSGVAVQPGTPVVVSAANSSPSLPTAVLGGAAARASVRRNVI